MIDLDKSVPNMITPTFYCKGKGLKFNGFF